MKPGQLFPNDLELAILKELAIEEPVLIDHLKELHVLSRKYTGVGSYTEFSPIKLLSLATGDKQFCLDSLIVVPGVKIGLGAVLFCQHGNPMCLEIYTFGDNYWDGFYSGFSIQKTAYPVVLADPLRVRQNSALHLIRNEDCAIF